jgi:hypothetical protein
MYAAEVPYRTLAMDAVLRIRDVYPGSRILIFLHPGSRISEIRDPRSGKNLFWIPDPAVKKAPDPGSAILYGGLFKDD